MRTTRFLCAALAAVIAASLPLTGAMNDALSVTARADETEGDWSYRLLDDGTISLTQYSGASTDVVVPSTYDGKTVSQLNDRFFGNDKITSLTIPTGVEIGGDGTTHNGSVQSRFAELPALERIILAEDHPYYSTVDGVLFNKDKTVLEYYPNAKKDSSYTVPDTVEYFEYPDAFYGHIDGFSASAEELAKSTSYPYLKSITLSNNTGIGYNPFQYCSALTEIKVNDDHPTLTAVDGVLFNKDITELRVYPSAKKDASYKIPDSVKTVMSAYAFSICPSLKSITISNSMSYMGLMGTSETQFLFDNCVSLEEIIVDEENETYSSVDGVVFNKDQTTLMRYPRSKGGTTYEIPDGVTRIDGGAFKYCDALTEITIPNSVTLIEGRAFQNCDALTHVIYEGTAEEWEALTIEYGNDCLTSATITFSKSTASQPTPSTPSTNQPETSEPEETKPTEFKPDMDDKELADLDEATKEVIGGITVTDSSGAFEDGVVMNVSKVESADGLFCFDITFTKDGVEVQPNGKVTVKVPVPEALKNGDIYVYHYDDDGNATLIPSKVENGFVIFATDKFSIYALSNGLIEDEAPDISSETSTPAPSEPTSGGASNPSTGIGYAFVPALIAAGAVIASAKKRR